MATYAVLATYTDQGIKNVKQSPQRVGAARELAKRCRGELKQFYLAMGAHDILVILDFPDDEAATQFVLTLGSLGNVRTSTLRLFSEDEFKKLVGALPTA